MMEFTEYNFKSYKIFTSDIKSFSHPIPLVPLSWVRERERRKSWAHMCVDKKDLDIVWAYDKHLFQLKEQIVFTVLVVLMSFHPCK